MSRLELSALDHVYLGREGNSIPFLFWYEQDLDVERVERAFRATARRCLGVAGTLARQGNDCHFDLSTDAAEFSVGKAPRGQPPAAYVDDVITTFGAPLARARVTRLEGGGTALAFAMSHVVADGYGYFLFLAAWAACANGVEFPMLNCDRSQLTRRDARGRSIEVREGPLPASGFVITGGGLDGKRWRWVEREVPGLGAGAGALSRGPSANDRLCAALWRDSLEYTSGEATSFSCAVDVRRSSARLGPMYFGNSSLGATITARAADVRDAPDDVIARWIREGVLATWRRVDEAVIELETLRASQGLEVFERVSSVPDEGFSVTNLSRLPIHRLDFGGGPPVDVDLVASPRLPGCVILPKSDGLRLLVSRP